MLLHGDNFPYQLMSVYPLVVGEGPNLLGEVIAVFEGDAYVSCWEEVRRREFCCWFVVPHRSPESESEHGNVRSFSVELLRRCFPVE